MLDQLTFLPEPFRSEGSSKGAALPEPFAAFYQAELRFVRGRRLRASVLRERFVVWAAANDQPHLSYRALATAMALLGHRRFRSNQVQYDDVAFATDVPELASNMPQPIAWPAKPRDGTSLLEQVDAALSSLLTVRRAIEAAGAAEAPHRAAELIVARRRP